MIEATIGSEDTAFNVINVSEGGLLAIGSRPLSVGDLHELRFRTATAGPAPQTWMFQARVAHCSPASENGGDTHAVGLEFVEPRTEQQQEAIAQFLRLCEPHGIQS